jgi:hypothetical protein
MEEKYVYDKGEPPQIDATKMQQLYAVGSSES